MAEHLRASPREPRFWSFVNQAQWTCARRCTRCFSAPCSWSFSGATRGPSQSSELSASNPACIGRVHPGVHSGVCAHAEALAPHFPPRISLDVPTPGATPRKLACALPSYVDNPDASACKLVGEDVWHGHISGAGVQAYIYRHVKK